jgi:O-antigen ligase
LAGLVLLLALPGVMSGLLNEGDNTYSVLTRIEAWKILWEIIKVSPLLGVGMANYYWYTTMFKILGYRVSFNSHNNYIDIAAQTGLIGLAVFIWFLWESLRLGLQTLKLVPEGFPKAYLIGVLGGLAGTAASGMLGDWILPFVYNIGLPGFRASVFTWVFLGGMLALAKFYLLPGQGEEHSAP